MIYIEDEYYHINIKDNVKKINRTDIKNIWNVL